MTSQHMECCQAGVPTAHYLVQCAKIRYVGVTCNMVEKCRGLIVIAAFYPNIIYSDEIRVRSLRTEQCMGNLNRGCSQMLSLNMYVSSLK